MSDKEPSAETKGAQRKGEKEHSAGDRRSRAQGREGAQCVKETELSAGERRSPMCEKGAQCEREKEPSV
ncbi:hypothetical protein chiPu_0010916 [Chiloscyllium punctatum]|uniref:Uncharacterized protein n=1 Tax=Chiloscyllium punctatum TaxID=137246 RepID=A0A401SPX5_CHIPU|nr:hypothetical protein [Chiloscyllium punctatum]